MVSMTKEYKFVVKVKTASRMSRARHAVLSAFALRKPDGCQFTLTEYRKPRSSK